MRNAITLEAIRVLDAIDRKKSFASAAESLFKVPSALSYTIQKLESDLEVSLFDRSRQRAQLTPAGKFILKQGRQILQSAASIEAAVKQLESGWEPSLRIARDSVLPLEPILSLVDEFLKLNKQIEIDISEEVLGGTWDSLVSGRCDIALGASGEPPKGQFDYHKIGDVRFTFAVASGHPLTRNKGVITSELIREYPAIISADSSLTLPARSSGLFESRQVIRVANFEAKVQAQQMGLGVGFLPTHLIIEEIKNKSLIGLPCEIPRPDIPIYASWNKEKTKGNALLWFITKLKQEESSLHLL